MGKDHFTMTTIDGISYYSVEEAARLSGASVRTVRRWIADGKLSDFLFPFRTKPNEVLYRLEPPRGGEVPDDKGIYSIMKGGGGSEGISSTGKKAPK